MAQRKMPLTLGEGQRHQQHLIEYWKDTFHTLKSQGRRLGNVVGNQLASLGSMAIATERDLPMPSCYTGNDQQGGEHDRF